MRQLELFDTESKPHELILIAGSNFLLLPAKKPLLSVKEALTLLLAAAVFLLPFPTFRGPSSEDGPLASQEQVLREGNPLPEGYPLTSAQAEPLPVPATPPPEVQILPKPPTPVHLSVPVLMYHHIGPILPANALDRDLTVSASDFEDQVKFFKEAGYQAVTLEQVYKALSGSEALPAKAIVFTFDDGYEDVFVHAVPILQKYGYVGSFAVMPGFLGQQNYATWDQVMAAYQQGMEIVSHTLHHIDLTSRKYSDDDLKVELEGSKLFLESRLNRPVDILVYPYGKYDTRAIEAVKKAGYKIAFTTEFGFNLSPNKAYALPRVRVHGAGGLAKLKQMLGRQIATSRQGP